MTVPILLFLGIILVAVVSGVRILNEYERGVVFRLGKCIDGVKGPGLVLIIPFGIDRMVKVDLRVVTMDVPTQDVITRDNVSVKVNAVIYFHVVSSSNAILEVEHYLYATSQLAQTSLRSICGQHELDLLTEQAINEAIQDVLDQETDPWGVKVNNVEVKQIDLPQEMQRAMAKQAEAERERRAKVIHADGELQAATKLKEAADHMAQSSHGSARYLQTLSEIATSAFDHALSVPIDLFNRFTKTPDSSE